MADPPKILEYFANSMITAGRWMSSVGRMQLRWEDVATVFGVSQAPTASRKKPHPELIWDAAL
jgi:hypothetical protein